MELELQYAKKLKVRLKWKFWLKKYNFDQKLTIIPKSKNIHGNSVLG